MVNIGEGKKFLTEWMDQHGFTKKDVQKRKKACEKRHVKKTRKNLVAIKKRQSERRNRKAHVQQCISRMGLNT